MNNKKIATIQTYNPHDCTSTGGDWTLYADGRIGVTTRTCWQGSRSDERWIFPNAIDMGAIGAQGDDDDAESQLTAWVENIENTYYDYAEAGMQKVRGGWVVQ